jgi:hypothetical protein
MQQIIRDKIPSKLLKQVNQVKKQTIKKVRQQAKNAHGGYLHEVQIYWLSLNESAESMS